MRGLLCASWLKEQGGNITAQDAEHLQRLDLFLQSLGYLLRCGAGQRTVTNSSITCSMNTSSSSVKP